MLNRLHSNPADRRLPTLMGTPEWVAVAIATLSLAISIFNRRSNERSRISVLEALSLANRRDIDRHTNEIRHLEQRIK
jgi:hypothetical protein